MFDMHMDINANNNYIIRGLVQNISSWGEGGGAKYTVSECYMGL